MSQPICYNTIDLLLPCFCFYVLSCGKSPENITIIWYQNAHKNTVHPIKTYVIYIYI